MAVRPIRIVGDPVLHTPTRLVTEFGGELHALVDDMYDTMAAAQGVGLAANQIGVDLRLFVYDCADEQGVRQRGGGGERRVVVGDDLQDALALAPANVNSLLNYGSLQWKIGQKDAAEQTFAKVLELDPRNRTALSSLGYLARDKGDAKLAENYFKRASEAHPKDYAPYLALGDLYTAGRDFHSAEANYENAYQRVPTNPLIVAGATNAALESHNSDLAKRWLDRAKGKMNDSPQVSRERERYLTLKGDYADSAKLGYAVLDKLPHDREGVVYLAYDLYYLNRYDDVAALVKKYDPVFPDDKDLALIAGYLDVRGGHLEEAVKDFTRALERDPKMATGYVNRGFVLNDLRRANDASKDFHTAIQLQANYGEAHLGLAFSDLQLHRPKAALAQLQIGQRLLGKSHTWRLARAEAFRQEQDFTHAEAEYRIALQEDPNDFAIHLAYADSLFRLRRFQPALAALDVAQKLAPTDARVYALKAQVHAKEGDRDATMRDVELAEKNSSNDVDILMSTGGALLTLGDRDAAMQRFSRALDVPNGDRIGVRLSIAQVFMRKGHYDEARRQIALGFAEARIGSSQVTAEDITEAANTMRGISVSAISETVWKSSGMVDIMARISSDFDAKRLLRTENTTLASVRAAVSAMAVMAARVLPRTISSRRRTATRHGYSTT